MSILKPICIVPLASAVKAPSAPKLTYRGGPVIKNVAVSTLFWGASWSAAPAGQLTGKINQFFDAIVVSSYLDQLSEYSVAGQPIGRGKRVGTSIASAQLAATVDDAAIQQFVAQQIASAAVPAAGPDSLYFVFVESGVVVDQGGSASCSEFCGYHDAAGGTTYYAVVPYPDCSGCSSGLAALHAITTTSSHELAEAVTDPVPGTGWYDDANGEIGDICAWQTKSVAGSTVQLLWSNATGKCV